jgi:hypothetical protein
MGLKTNTRENSLWPQTVKLKEKMQFLGEGKAKWKQIGIQRGKGEDKANELGIMGIEVIETGAKKKTNKDVKAAEDAKGKKTKRRKIRNTKKKKKTTVHEGEKEQGKKKTV